MKNMFNIYYINHEKASEISMLFDNEIVEKITRIKNTEFVLSGDADATTGTTSKLPVIGKYLPSIDLSGNLSHNRSNRVEDTVKVVSSKSTILRPIYEKAKEVRRLDDSKVGNLVKIKDVYLTVVNSDDVMATKALMSGLVSQVPVEGIGNMNFTSLMEVMFKGSAYVLCGKLSVLNSCQVGTSLLLAKLARGTVPVLSIVPDLGTSRSVRTLNSTCTQVCHKFKIAKRGFQLVDELTTGGTGNYSQVGNN